MSFTPVGDFIQAQAAAFTLAPVNAGDLILIEVQNDSATVWCDGVAGGGCTWEQVGDVYSDDLQDSYGSAVVFAGTVTETGPQTATLSFSGTVDNIRCAGQEFTSSTGSWALDGQQGNLGIGPSGGTDTMPSLAPSAAGELYFCFSNDTGEATPGSTSGYTYDVDANGNGLAFNPDCTSGAQAPVWADDGLFFGVAVLMSTGGSPAAAASLDVAVTMSAAGLGEPQAAAALSVAVTASAAAADPTHRAAASLAVAVIPAAAAADLSLSAAAALTVAVALAAAGLDTKHPAAALTVAVAPAAAARSSQLAAASLAVTVVPAAAAVAVLKTAASLAVAVSVGAAGSDIQLRTLEFSVAAVAGTDPYGNDYPAGIAFQTTAGAVVMNTAGIFFYNGKLSAGELVIAMAPADGTDPYGNDYYEGLTISGDAVITINGEGALDVGSVSAGSIDTLDLTVGTVSYPGEQAALPSQYPLTVGTTDAEIEACIEQCNYLTTVFFNLGFMVRPA